MDRSDGARDEATENARSPSSVRVCTMAAASRSMTLMVEVGVEMFLFRNNNDAFKVYELTANVSTIR